MQAGVRTCLCGLAVSPCSHRGVSSACLLLHMQQRWSSDHGPQQTHMGRANGAENMPEVPERLIGDWTPGSRYYFSPEEEERFFTPASALRPSVSTRKTGVTHPPPSSPATLVNISGVLRSFIVDTAVPPLRREEAERWSLEGYVYERCLGVRRTPEKVEPRYLLPPDAMVTYLGEDIRKLDQLYRQHGLYTISEVAEAILPYVPTYMVEVRQVIAALPPDLMHRIEGYLVRDSMAGMIFSKYPMLFVSLRNRYQRSLVRLNGAWWFVRQHPGYGRADATMRRHRRGPTPPVVTPTAGETIATAVGSIPAGSPVEGMETASRSAALVAPEEVKPLLLRQMVFHAMVRNLPRVAGIIKTATVQGEDDAALDAIGSTGLTPEGDSTPERYKPLHLISWINSFPEEDKEILVKAPEDMVVRLLQEYVHVFQLVSPTETDASIFVKGSVLLRSRHPATATLRPAGEAEERDEWADDVEGSGDLLDEGAKSPKLCTAGLQRSGKNAAAPPNLEETQRIAAFKKAVVDDLIDFDGILKEDAEPAIGITEDGSLNTPSVPDQAMADGDADEDWSWTEDNTDGMKKRTAESTGAVWRKESRAPPPSETPANHMLVLGLPLEEIYVRRLPPNIAPRSLSDWDETTSPDPELVALAARFLSSPPSLRMRSDNVFTRAAAAHSQSGLSSTSQQKMWRWVAVSRIYQAYSEEQRLCIRHSYKGIVNFLRYHGRLFQLSSDLMYVIAHDPSGALAPIPVRERVFSAAERVVLPPDFDDNPDALVSQVGEAERLRFEKMAGESQVPQRRHHILLLDPENPVLTTDVLHEEMADLLPDFPVKLADLLRRLPPLLRAALPTSMSLRNSKSLDTFEERGCMMVRKKTTTAAVETEASTVMSVEDAIGEVLQLPLGPQGTTPRALTEMHLSAAAVQTLRNHFGSVSNALRAFPQYFEVHREEVGRRSSLVLKLRR